MPSLTREQALRETIALWTYLAENPEFSFKAHAVDAMGPDYAHLRDYDSECPCCQYARSQHMAGLALTLFCTDCPMDSWRETAVTTRMWHPCLHDINSYGGWTDTDDELTRAETAQALVDLAKQSLAGLTV